MIRLRAPASLIALTASYVVRRPRAAFPAAQIAWRVGKQVRKAPILRPDRNLLARADELVAVCSLVAIRTVRVSRSRRRPSWIVFVAASTRATNRGSP
ncbi:MAG TPA: hypothetical protein VIV40_31830, partial [Kofleriaceae bacterium]